MKNLKKTMAALVVSSLLLTGCAPTVNPGPNADGNILSPTQPATPTLPVIPQDTVPTEPSMQGPVLVPMTADVAAEIEAAWFAATGTSLGTWFDAEEKNQSDGVRYYGTYADYQIIFRPNGDDAITELKIESVTFSHNIGFELYAYHNGSFIPVKQLVEQGALTVQDLGIINLRHISYELQPSEGFVQLPTVSVGVYDILEQMKLAFLRLHDTKGEHSVQDLSVTYYGEYNGAHVGFINGILMYTQALTSETVAGVTFCYPTGQKLLVYFEGELMYLADAYDRGVLTKEQLRDLRDAYAPKDDSYVAE